MRIQLSEHFTYKKLLRFSLPTIAMMIFTSIYGIVDGFFVSNYVGKTAFAAVNLIMPYLMIQGCFGFMIGTGGGALVAKTLGEKRGETANRYFTMLICFTVMLGVLISTISILFMRPIVLFLGAEGAMIQECMTYGTIMSAFNAAFMLQFFFQSFFVVAEKPNLGFGITVAAGMTNIVLDALFIAVFHWGAAGAAIASGLGQCVGGVLPLLYFAQRQETEKEGGRSCHTAGKLRNTNQNGGGRFIKNLRQRLLRADVEYFGIGRRDALQFPVDEIRRGKRYCGIRRGDVYPDDLFCHLYRLCGGDIAHCQLSLRGGKPRGDEEPSEKEPAYDGGNWDRYDAVRSGERLCALRHFCRI